ncbi:MAG: hypothetical protein WC916_01590 [Candidatus Woesearchaeota archaeon]
MGEYRLKGKKRGIFLLLVLFLFVITFVSAETQLSCNLNGGVWCGGNKCILPLATTLDNCVVSVTQSVLTPGLTSEENFYIFDQLEIKSGIRVWFYSNKELSIASINGGAGGAGGTANGGDGPPGGKGGDGGKTGEFGLKGEDTPYSTSPQPTEMVGSVVSIRANILDNNGFLVVDGISSTDAKCVGGDIGTVGKGGAGGIGGSGAGLINMLVMDTVTSFGTITAKGGQGSNGAAGTDDGGTCSGGDADGGSGGGSGGGGAGGLINIYSPKNKIDTFKQKFTANTISCVGGGEGYRGDAGGPEATPGKTGIKGADGSCQKIVKDIDSLSIFSGGELDSLPPIGRAACFDNKSNDADIFIDFEDKDCFNDNTNNWTTRNGPLIIGNTINGIKKGSSSAPLWWDPFALNSSDAVCGDDGFAEGICVSNIQITTQSSPGVEYGACTSYTLYGGVRFIGTTTKSDCGANLWLGGSCVADQGTCIAPAAVVCSSIPSPCEYSKPSLCNPDISSTATEFCLCDNKVYRVSDGGTCAFAAASTNCATLDEESCTGQCVWNKPLPDMGFFKDYGFITNPYLCYNNRSDLRKPVDKWSWVDGQINENAFKIFTLNNSGLGKVVDTISNGNSWWYCNANTAATSGLLGSPIIPLGTFSMSTAVNGEPTCGMLMTLLFNRQFKDGCGGIFNDCCEDVAGQTVTTQSGNLGPCKQTCYIAGGQIGEFSCSNPSFANTAAGKILCSTDVDITNPTPTADFFDKAACLLDPSVCIPEAFNSGNSCTTNGGKPCTTDQYCVGGVVKSTSDSAACCYSGDKAAFCKNKPQPPITNSATCTAFGGYVYNKTKTPDICPKTAQRVEDMSDGYSCCMAKLFTVSTPGISEWYRQANPSSYFCANVEGDSLIMQCVFDNRSRNADIVSASEFDRSKNRIKALGGVAHQINSYDFFRNGISVDRVRNVQLISGKSSRAYTASQTNYFLSDYAYLEFDIAFPSSGTDMNVTLTVNNTGTGLERSVNLGPLSKFISNGNNAPTRWNHAIVDLSTGSILPTDLYRALIFNDSVQETYNIVLDSVFLTPKSTSTNSPNYYCTGPFATWIDNLDPPLNTPANALGPYQYTCNAYAAFGWTGSKCCGDDTRFNYGEFYTDDQAGCFNGTIVRNDRTIAETFNKPEGTEYIYKDLLYYQGKFYGCQVDSNKYANLMKSEDGIKGTTILFDASNTQYNKGSECTVVGTHYCSNGEWFSIKSITGSGNLSKKSVPAGGNLIINGGFD